MTPPQPTSTEDPPATADTAAAANSNNKKEKKKKPDNFVIPPKKPKLTKAERRALQEQQRAAKQQAGRGGGRGGGGGGQQQQQKGGGGGGANKGATPKQQQPEATAEEKKVVDDTVKSTAEDDGGGKTVSLVSHLAPYRDPSKCLFRTGATLAPFSGSAATSADPTSTGSGGSSHHRSHSYSHGNVQLLHPAVIELGYQYATGQIRGGNARCRAMLHCYKRVLQDYVPAGGYSPETDDGSSKNNNNNNKKLDLRQALDHDVLKASFQYWTTRCRVHSVSMGNAFTFFKAAVAALDRDMQWPQMQLQLIETLTAYEQERLVFAGKAIADLASSDKILRDDGTEVILTYGNSETVRTVLEAAVQKRKKFRVICVDSRPLLEGKRFLEDLMIRTNNNSNDEEDNIILDCTYVLLNALTYVLQDGGVTKVLLGASALMSDGSVLGRVGSAAVALAAHAHNIPVLVCSETYKISNRIQLESITGVNELGNPESLATVVNTTMNEQQDGGGVGEDTSSGSGKGVLKDWKDTPKLKIMNLLYDLTPAKFVTGIITEFGIVPPTSVAVLLREMYPQEFINTK